MVPVITSQYENALLICLPQGKRSAAFGGETRYNELIAANPKASEVPQSLFENVH